MPEPVASLTPDPAFDINHSQLLQRKMEEMLHLINYAIFPQEKFRPNGLLVACLCSAA